MDRRQLQGLGQQKTKLSHKLDDMLLASPSHSKSASYTPATSLSSAHYPQFYTPQDFTDYDASVKTHTQITDSNAQIQAALDDPYCTTIFKNAFDVVNETESQDEISTRDVALDICLTKSITLITKASTFRQLIEITFLEIGIAPLHPLRQNTSGDLSCILKIHDIASSESAKIVTQLLQNEEARKKAEARALAKHKEQAIANFRFAEKTRTDLIRVANEIVYSKIVITTIEDVLRKANLAEQGANLAEQGANAFAEAAEEFEEAAKLEKTKDEAKKLRELAKELRDEAEKLKRVKLKADKQAMRRKKAVEQEEVEDDSDFGLVNLFPDEVDAIPLPTAVVPPIERQQLAAEARQRQQQAERLERLKDERQQLAAKKEVKQRKDPQEPTGENGTASAATCKKLGTSLADQLTLAQQRTRAPTPIPRAYAASSDAAGVILSEEDDSDFGLVNLFPDEVDAIPLLAAIHPAGPPPIAPAAAVPFPVAEDDSESEDESSSDLEDDSDSSLDNRRYNLPLKPFSAASSGAAAADGLESEDESSSDSEDEQSRQKAETAARQRQQLAAERRRQQVAEARQREANERWQLEAERQQLAAPAGHPPAIHPAGPPPIAPAAVPPVVVAAPVAVVPPVVPPAGPPPIAPAAAVPPVVAAPVAVVPPVAPPAGPPPIAPAAAVPPVVAAPVAVVPPVAPPAGPPATVIPLAGAAPAGPIVDDWVIVDAEVPIEEEVIIVSKATTTIEIPTATYDIALQTKSQSRPEIKVLPPITETHIPKIENLSIKYQFSPVTRKSGNVIDGDNINSDDETKTLLLSRFNPTIRDRADLTETDVPMVTPYYNTLMLWQDRRRPDKRSLPKVIDRFGYSENIRVC